MRSVAEKELLEEIDSTLDQLISNAEVLGKISSNPSYTEEVAALHKTQESLLARLMHLDQSLEKKRRTEAESIRSKLENFSILNSSFNEEVATYFEGKKKRKRAPSKQKPKIHRKRRLTPR